MSESALFMWGTAFFFIVGSGAFIYGLATVRERFDESKKLHSWGSE
jgi:hypothetical protein